jgi:hypothetical protein
MDNLVDQRQGGKWGESCHFPTHLGKSGVGTNHALK